MIVCYVQQIAPVNYMRLRVLCIKCIMLVYDLLRK